MVLLGERVADAQHEYLEPRHVPPACLAILETDPEHIDALHQLGVVQYQLGALDIALVRRALARDSERAHIHNSEGLVLGELGQREDAVCAFERAIELEPAFLEAKMSLAGLFFDGGDFERAVALYRDVVEQSPSLASAHDKLGIAPALSDEGEEALAAVERTIEVDATSVDAYFNKGNLCRAKARDPPQHGAPGTRQLP